MVLIFELLILAFFGHGELLVCHSELCRCVSGLYSKIHVYSPVMTCLKKVLSLSMRSRRSRHTFLRVSFCSLVRIFGTRLAQIFCIPSSKVKISWTVWRFKFNTLLIILTVKRRSDLTRSLTLVTFSSVFHVQGLPQRGSSVTLSRPSKNALCHRKTCVLDRARSP